MKLLLSPRQRLGYFYRGALLLGSWMPGELIFMQSFPFPFRTELLGCYSDQDFLAKLHCVRQAFQVRMSQWAAWGWPSSWLLHSHSTSFLAACSPAFKQEQSLCPSRASKSRNSPSSPCLTFVILSWLISFGGEEHPLAPVPSFGGVYLAALLF